MKNPLPHQTAERLRKWAENRERLALDGELLRRAADELDLVEPIRQLRNEVNCRIEHGAQSGGHLEYVQARLDELLNPGVASCDIDKNGEAVRF